MKHWFKRKIYNWLIADTIEQPVKKPAFMHNDGAFRFSLHRATGGIVVELQKYNKQKDNLEQSLYIITNEDNMGESLSKIITLESLK